MPPPGPSPRKPAIVALALLAALASCVPARAGTLVLRRGGWIRTRGPWLRLGDRIRFRSMAGELRTLPVDEVDLEASGGGRVRPERSEVPRYAGGRWRGIPSPSPGPAPGARAAPPPRRPEPICRLESVGRDEPPRLTCDPERRLPEARPPDPEPAGSPPEPPDDGGP